MGKVKKEIVEDQKKEKTERAKEKFEKIQKKWEELTKDRQLENLLVEQFKTGRLLACISSRPGQSGRADGYILEGTELEFYKKKMMKKNKQ